MPRLNVTTKEFAAMAGQKIGPSDWTTVTQEMVQTYGETVGDLWWIHVDVPRAKKAFGGTIVYGLLTLSLVPKMMNEIMSITDQGNDLNYGYDNVRFLSVVHGGDRIRLTAEIIGAEPRRDGVLCRTHCVVEVEGGEKPALVADWTLLVVPGGDESMAEHAGLVGAS